eukprot:scaffold914_cov103-Skeletonema_dohrnii-CCMP3373.AAC.7
MAINLRTTMNDGCLSTALAHQLDIRSKPIHTIRCHHFNLCEGGMPGSLRLCFTNLRHSSSLERPTTSLTFITSKSLKSASKKQQPIEKK